MDRSEPVTSSTEPHGVEPVPPVWLYFRPMMPVFLVPLGLPVLPPPENPSSCMHGPPDRRPTDLARSEMTSDASTIPGGDEARPCSQAACSHCHLPQRDLRPTASGIASVPPSAPTEKCRPALERLAGPVDVAVASTPDDRLSPISFGDLDPLDPLFLDATIDEPTLLIEDLATRPPSTLPRALDVPEPATSDDCYTIAFHLLLQIRSIISSSLWAVLLHTYYNPDVV
ncbi:hypothetical protein QAD02_022439 [Eretmocerus hayati]|uniref:Uncharacterized protein n=1 Tax=Eretmocerus hayati TaxID=131215 RepID=A0ACC2PT95_9HYME|nr:hypothetical protein QAD02_022439 [Eretmocerus hayati]